MAGSMETLPAGFRMPSMSMPPSMNLMPKKHLQPEGVLQYKEVYYCTTTVLQPLFSFLSVYQCAYHSLCLCWLTNCTLYPLCATSSSPGAPETWPLGCSDLFMLTTLCLLTGALMLTGKLTDKLPETGKLTGQCAFNQHCSAMWHDQECGTNCIVAIDSAWGSIKYHYCTRLMYWHS